MNTLTLVSALMFLAACSPSAGDPDRSDSAGSLGTGAMLSVDYFGDTDVVGFHFELTRVSCDGEDAITPTTIEANVDLVDGIFPGMVELVEQTLDPDSRHLGSDLFMSLEPGCYDIMAAPASAIDGDSWTPSSDCSVADAEGIEVLAGYTSDVTLISQCVGDEIGALDTLVTLNHPPSLLLGIDEKFNYECESVEVCVSAYDVDDDPIELELTQIITGGEGSAYHMELGDAEVIGFEAGHRIWEQCATIVTQITDTYTFEVTIYDLGWSDGNLVHMEELVSPETSSASLQFPVYTNWIEEPKCLDEDGVLVDAEGSSIDRWPGCTYLTAELYYCSGLYDIDESVVDYLCDGTTLIEEALYPVCPTDSDSFEI